jgi:predicted phage terminase large subunit-like protein
MPQFVDGWLYVDLCARLRQFAQDIRDGKSPRLIVSLPPRHLKSQTCSVRFPVWLLLQNPAWEVVVASYGQDLANKFSRFARALIEFDPYIKTLWPWAKLSRDQTAVQEWRLDTTQKLGGTFRAVGRGAGLTGSGANCLIIDDVLKDAEEADSITVREHLWDWYNSVAMTRLSPGGGVLVIGTRWHTQDLTGMLLTEAKNNPLADQWQVVDYKAIAEVDEPPYRKAGDILLPGRFTKEQLEKVKASMSPRWWEALYQQRPTTVGGNLFKDDKFKRYITTPQEFDSIIQVWDLRFGKSKDSGSFVCGWVMARKGGSFYILDEARGRWSYAESREQIRALTDKWPQAIAKLIENKANGPAIESDLEFEIPGILLYDPRGDKIQRAERILPLVLAGNTYLPDDSIAPWVRDAISELSAFPRGANDDRVDCLSMGLAYLHDQVQEVQTVLAL